MTVDNRNNKKETCVVVLAKKPDEEVWKEYKSQREAATVLNLRTSNINKVIKGHLKTTGGYLFKTETKAAPKTDTPSWEQIKKDNDFDRNLAVLGLSSDCIQCLVTAEVPQLAVWLLLSLKLLIYPHCWRSRP